MTEHLYPKTVADLELAPVLISIERNLAQLREADDLEYALVLELNDDASYYRTQEERAQRVQRYATRFVTLHGLTIEPTPDGYGLAVSHGDFAVTLGLGKQLADYVTVGRSK